ncbi:hypothetical protein CAI16_14995 [Virgibacillus dokdonensis]|uniref:Integrase catalytic domain-containing protein n=1 Tax=Virgibacillus dokdonensis TaxID=302167 RepID=A0A3E0WMK3_9BACI|nr:hypothetical protein CAI16_14995 [Virgibacillus dokdonensis]
MSYKHLTTFERARIETWGRFNVGTSITKRPKEIRKRETFGHWELDSVVSSRGKSKRCFAPFVERKTRWYLALKMPNRTAISMEQAIRTLHERLPDGAFQTATVNRGKEFVCHSSIEQKMDNQVYFAVPYSSGRMVAMRMQMVYYLSSSLRKPIWLKSQMQNYKKH